MRKISMFYKVYLIVLALFAALLIVGAVVLSVGLEKYNEGLPETVSSKFFFEAFQNADVSRITKLAKSQRNIFKSDDEYYMYVKNNLIHGDLSYTSTATGKSDSSKKYIVKSGDNKIASFTLLPDNKNRYYVAELNLFLPEHTERKYRILNGSTLYINGEKVDDKYITDTTDTKIAKYIDGDVPGTKWITYTVFDIITDPEVYVTDRLGRKTDLTKRSGIMSENILQDKVDVAIVQRITEAAEEYAKCMQNDTTKASALKYFVKGTDVYENIRKADNAFVWEHSGYSFEDVTSREFFKYNDDTVSCRISFTHVLKKEGSKDYKDYTDITYFAKKVNGEYMIFAMYNS